MVFVATLHGCVASSAATLRWDPNPPEDNIAFYTVYAESLTDTLKREVRDGTSFELDELLSNLTYLLSVSATSAEGFVPAAATNKVIGSPASTLFGSGWVIMLGGSCTITHPGSLATPTP